ncbi:MAG: hypothetical protein JNM54_13880 [Candidatus Accumulibacter sp.]|jgi:hypothetical protein|uniref:hypothetical protein n=1 Tax=unclassified Candidatus Accumulibacter TaxID=2619054 RepID=UPI0012D112E8|nr:MULTISPECIES: hypothetical protein [unclassified Candidatus Accumulibacter]MBL8368982.1 hypothetical protein [Accumulibacter sp.]MBN8513215.1 hypothetical protein [Accumulibacter sp.]MQM33270.1 hypothetical protein [Candidatus Accumulibacter phosphatis]HRI90302.1 hypothetical protein [Accumulibacter sp.]
MKQVIRQSMMIAFLAGSPALVSAEALQRVSPSDAELDCTGLAAQEQAMAEFIAAGDPNAPSIGKAAAGGVANAGGQVAGAAVAQGAGLFGGLGGLVGKVAGAVAQQQVQESMAPDAAAQQRAAEAKERKGFLGKLAIAKECRPDEPAFPGKTLSADEFRKLAEGPAAGAVQPLTVAAVQAVASEPIVVLERGGLLEGKLNTAGKRIYISEFRVLFEVGGEVSASTRAGYLPGTNYGATRSRIKYQVANVDVAALQVLTDRAWADLKERLAAGSVEVEDAAAFTAANGAVYAATEAASTIQAPVYVEQDLGHTTRKYLVLTPTGMKLHERGFAGLGAGNMGKRIDWSKSGFDGIAIGVAINIAALETSGSGSSILNPDGANTGAGEGMSVTAPPGAIAASGHVDGGSLRMAKGIAVGGNFARFREVGGFDSQKNAAVVALQVVGNLAGVAANKSKVVEMEVDLDGPTTSRMALSGLATYNQALAEQFKAGRQASGG